MNLGPRRHNDWFATSILFKYICSHDLQWTKKKGLELTDRIYFNPVSLFPFVIPLIFFIFHALDGCLIDTNYNIYSALKYVFFLAFLSEVGWRDSMVWGYECGLGNQTS